MPITYKDGIYLAQGVREVSPFTGSKFWRYNRYYNGFMCSNILGVAPHAEQCVGEAKVRVDTFIAERKASVADSIAASADIKIPAPEGLVYRPYQLAGIAYAMKRKDTLIADAMRLGKTIQALGVMNALPDLQSALIITPAGVKVNWLREFRKWNVHAHLTAGVVEGGHNPQFPVTIINYDVLDRHIDWIQSQEWDVLICDESHYLRGQTAHRTKLVLGGPRNSQRGIPRSEASIKPINAKLKRMFLSGTQMFVRPVDLFTVCQAFDPHGLGRNRFAFIERYCGATAENGWDDKGASNLEELQFKMRQLFMVRREKTDVAKEMPPTRSTYVISKHGLESYVRDEQKVVAREIDTLSHLLNGVLDAEAVDQVLKTFGTEVQNDGSIEMQPMSLSSARRELALAKLPHCVEFIKELRLSESKVVIFAHHRTVIETLREAFPNSARVYGGLTTDKRQAEVDRFVADPDCGEFIGQIQAAGQGINLSVADVVVFVELAWEPSFMDQAEERVWEPTKERPITIYRVVVEDSLDYAMSVTLEKRQEDISRTMVASRMNEVAHVAG